MSLNTKLEGSVQIPDLALERRNSTGAFFFFFFELLVVLKSA